jgi:hypothetical protein
MGDGAAAPAVAKSTAGAGQAKTQNTAADIDALATDDADLFVKESGKDDKARPRTPHSLVRRIIGFIVVTVSLGGAALWQLQTRAADHVSDAEEAARQVAFAQLRDVTLENVPKDEVALALTQMSLSQQDRVELGGLLVRPPEPPASSMFPDEQPKNIRLARMKVWDTHSADGDIVAIVSAGYRQEVTLSAVPQQISVPVDDSQIVQVVGVQDGSGGGITLAVRGAAQEVLMPIMSTSQILSLPIAR